MTTSGGNDNMFTTTSYIRGEDIELGNITEQVGIINCNAQPTEISFTKVEDVGGISGHVEDIDDWVASLERMLEDVPSYMCNPAHPGRITRIPNHLREVDVKGYEPYIMSIGPYHQGKPGVQQMEMSKKFVLKCVLKNKPELTLRDYLLEILSTEPTVRSFYSHIEMENEELVRMLLLDSVFLVTTFCGLPIRQERMAVTIEEDPQINEDNGGTGSIDENSQMIINNDEVKSGENWYWNLFAHDVLLLENQLPFFLLQKIYNFAYGGSERQLIDIMKCQILNMSTNFTRLDTKMVISRPEEVHHLLHLCHMFFRPTIQQYPTTFHFAESTQMFRLGSAVQLYEAGVRFEARSMSAEYTLLDITFNSSGNFVMPCLHIDDNTESLLRNLVALEQMKYPRIGLHVSAYVVLMLHLITTPKDVELLRRKGIVQHHLASDKEMMYLVNRLSVGLAFDYAEDNYSLKGVFRELKRYSEHRLPRWRAWIKHRHFSNPWTIISLLVASLFLVLTALQTYYSVYSFYYPYHDGH